MMITATGDFYVLQNWIVTKNGYSVTPRISRLADLDCNEIPCGPSAVSLLSWFMPVCFKII